MFSLITMLVQEDLSARTHRGPRQTESADGLRVRDRVTSHAAHAAPGTAAGKLPTFDCARFVAAVAVVWAHTPETPAMEATQSLGRFALPFFVLASILFSMRGAVRHPERPVGSYVRGRVMRLYMPFLAWSAAFLIARLVKRRLMEDPRPLDLGASAFWDGTAMHLWFLPFILAASVACYALARFLARRSATTARATMLAAVVAGAAVAFVPVPEGAPYLVTASWTVLPSVFWGVAFAVSHREHGRLAVRSGSTATAGLGLALAGSVGLFVLGTEVPAYQFTLIRNIAGFGFLLFALAPAHPALPIMLARCGGTAFGLYLTHPLFVEALQTLARARGLAPSGLLDLTYLTGAVGGGVLLTLLLQKSRWTRWTVV